MWCPTCQADVAAELTPDQRRLLCARCHTEMALSATDPSRPGSIRVSDAERNARDLLARWSADSILEIAQPADADEIHSPVTIPVVEAPITVAPASSTVPSDDTPIPLRGRRRASSRVPPSPAPKPWLSTVAQFVAYGGIAGIAYGAALILWSHFGGPPHYAPTGWLLATVGQMLLFLGLVTLVAGSLERFSEQMERRFAELTERVEMHRRRRHRRADEVTSRAA
jgi:hypothetical protein